MVRLLAMVLLLVAWSVGVMPADNIESTCPVCLRVLKAVKALGRSQGVGLSSAFDSYCLLSQLDVEDQKFCYNTENVRSTLNRLLEIGAHETRICKKVFSMNPDFCKVKKAPVQASTVILNERYKTGIIYI